MPAATAPAPAAPANRANGGGRNGEPQRVEARPFVAGSRPIDEAKYDDTLTLTTSTQKFDSFPVSPQGFLGGLWLQFVGTTTGNAATVAFADDAPWNVADTIYFQDVGQQPILGPMGGYDVMIVNKYGGYHFVGDPKASAVYSVTAGAGATGGSFEFWLYIPVELVHRDALGSLPNTSGSAQFRVDVTAAAIATIYDTAPTNPANVRLRYELEGWQDPSPTDIQGQPVSQNPPAPQTTQYWQVFSEDISAGAFDRKLTNFNGLMRNLIFINRRAADIPAAGRANGDADWPDPFTFMYEKNLLVDSRIRSYWRHRIAEDYGYTGVEAAGAGSAAYTTGILTRDLGVYPLSWARDFGLQVGAELRLGYLPISDATNMAIKGSMGAAAQLRVLVNYVRYMGDPKALTMGK